ncbi:helix-turn-helix domain-containing protein [Corynebacterium sp. A21]|uniref:helix-turn-helix domain-containing protein n=1 Tax=Corynebacterium sp. A21 TaxID=3457318 RepID=UPI003FD39BFB
MNEKYMTSKEVGEKCGISHGTVANWRKVEGRGPSFVTIGGRYFYPTDLFNQWFEKSFVRGGIKEVAA